MGLGLVFARLALVISGLYKAGVIALSPRSSLESLGWWNW